MVPPPSLVSRVAALERTLRAAPLTIAGHQPEAFALAVLDEALSTSGARATIQEGSTPQDTDRRPLVYPWTECATLPAGRRVILALANRRWYVLRAHCDETSSDGAFADCFGCHSGSVPDEYQIDVAGIVNWTASLCPICTTLNGTYVLPRVSACLFALDIPDVCGYNRIELLVGGSGYYVSFLRSASPLAALRYVEEHLPAPRDCRETAFNLDAQGGVGYCNHFVSTLTITAL